jgi:ABC-type nickel/cobalt efflux system permease component RcnA
MYSITPEGPLLKLFGFFTVVPDVGAIVATLLFWWKIYSIFAFVLSAFFLFVTIYSRIRYEELRHHQHHDQEHEVEHYAHIHTRHSKNDRWQEAVHHADSDNPNDWRLAIIEADIMLEKMLDSIGLPGMTVGDKLKSASPHSFRTLEDAWQAHKIRNQIAHKGTDFVLTKRLTKETIERYRHVFEEFSTI